MSNKIYVIGDSFVTGCKYALGYNDWKESSGNLSKFGDLHWSGKYNRLFAIWINKLINKKEIINYEKKTLGIRRFVYRII